MSFGLLVFLLCSFHACWLCPLCFCCYSCFVLLLLVVSCYFSHFFFWRYCWCSHCFLTLWLMFALSSRVIVVICVVFSHCYAIHIAFSHYCCCLLLALPFCSCVGHVVHVVLSRFHCYSSWATVAIVTTFVTLPFVLLFL
jgi:hypothetical protein